MDFPSTIDHTLLRPEASRAEIVKVCEETLEFGFASACLHPFWVKPMAERFPSLNICTVINFPLGLHTVVLQEAERAVIEGARELDIVVNPVHVMESNWDAIEEDLKSYRKIFQEIKLKLIVESSNRSDDEIIKLTEICSFTGFDFIKTSTGFAKEGASVRAVSLMAKHAKDGLYVKASGGIRTLADAWSMINAGAVRIGTSNGVALYQEYERAL